MCDSADDVDRGRSGAGSDPDAELLGLVERIAERTAILTLDAALEAARSADHGASPAREGAQLKEQALYALEAFEDIDARRPR